MKDLHLTVFEPGDMIGTMSKDGKVAIWSVTTEGALSPADSRLFGNTTGLTTETPIEELDLTVRTFNTLKREGVNTVGDILDVHDEKGDEGFLDMRNMGQKNLDEINDWITQLRPSDQEIT
jgi:DNA-directed RNA polymerase alpha subunit